MKKYELDTGKRLSRKAKLVLTDFTTKYGETGTKVVQVECGFIRRFEMYRRGSGRCNAVESAYGHVLLNFSLQLVFLQNGPSLVKW